MDQPVPEQAYSNDKVVSSTRIEKVLSIVICGSRYSMRAKKQLEAISHITHMCVEIPNDHL